VYHKRPERLVNRSIFQNEAHNSLFNVSAEELTVARHGTDVGRVENEEIKEPAHMASMAMRNERVTEVKPRRKMTELKPNGYEKEVGK
jgi:hypothetical protein